MHDDVATLQPPRVAHALHKKVKFDGEKSGGDGPDCKDIPKKVYCTSFESRIGRIYVASTERGVCKISVPKESRKDFFEWLKGHFDNEMVIDHRAKNKDVIDQLSRYFNGKLAKFTCPI